MKSSGSLIPGSAIMEVRVKRSPSAYARGYFAKNFKVSLRRMTQRRHSPHVNSINGYTRKRKAGLQHEV